MEISGTNLDLVTGLTVGSQQQSHEARTTMRVWQDRAGERHTEHVSRHRAVAASGHPDSHMVAMRVEVGLPRDVAQRFAGPMFGSTSWQQPPAGMRSASSRTEGGSPTDMGAAGLAAGHVSSGRSQQRSSAAVATGRRDLISTSQLVELGLSSSRASHRQASARSMGPAGQAQAAAVQGDLRPVPTLTVKLHTDFSTHVQTATCRRWQVWLVGDSHACDHIWDQLHQQEATWNGPSPASGTALLPCALPIKLSQMFQIVLHSAWCKVNESLLWYGRQEHTSPCNK